jgi:hypothetical protein
VQLDNDLIGDLNTAQGAVFPVPEDVARRAIIEHHEDRLNWRLQRAFEDHRRQLPAIKALKRRGISLPAKPLGFG